LSADEKSFSAFGTGSSETADKTKCFHYEGRREVSWETR